MKQRELKNVLDREFRANPAYEIVGFERMTDAELSALAGLKQDPDCFGILRPQPDSGLNIKSVCKDTALLLYSLQQPGPLPAHILAELDADGNQQIAELVLDEILQISHDGHFVSGADAHHLIYRPGEAVENHGRIARLSLEAVKFGQRLTTDDPIRLSAHMYFYNRAPVTPAWQRGIGDAESITHFLGINGGGPCARLLEQHWSKSTPRPDTQGWNIWSLKKSKSSQWRHNGYDFKIYVSPALAAMPEVVPVVAEVFTEAEVERFKIGAELPGLTRPDKIVAYLATFEHVEEVGRMLSDRLKDIPVHGVPFTADLSDNGLLSWGMDPHEKTLLEWQESASWRLWITHRLAQALLVARSSTESDIEPWRFALERLRLEGIDTDTWTPTGAYQEKTG
jgi:hypothetical protein